MKRNISIAILVVFALTPIAAVQAASCSLNTFIPPWYYLSCSANDDTTACPEGTKIQCTVCWGGLWGLVPYANCGCLSCTNPCG